MSCRRKDCPQPNNISHYHCGNCTSPEVTSMMGHYVNDKQTKLWGFTCKKEDVVYGREMTFDGEDGRFLTTDEYDELTESNEAQELEDLRSELSNLREHVREAYDHAHDLYYHLGNA